MLIWNLLCWKRLENLVLNQRLLVNNMKFKMRIKS